MSQEDGRWIFTFGHGHTHPDTGETLMGRYVVIQALTSEMARAKMIRLFGTKWAMQYDTEESAGVHKYGLVEL